MNYFQPYLPPLDDAIVAAWDAQIAEAAETPFLAQALAQSADLFPRFAACYAQLRALPRGARRALQRQLARSGELTAVPVAGELGSFLSGNVAKVRTVGTTGYITAYGGVGGGVANTGSLSVINSTISGNTAKGKTVKVKYGKYTYSYFYGGLGGGILNYNPGYLYLSGGTVTKNTALIGGGLLEAGYSTIIGTSISGNKASYGDPNIFYY